MDQSARHLIENWTVDYGEGHVEQVCVPHAWRQDVPVSFEGPVAYRTELEVPRKPTSLRFHGVSYLAEVFVDGELKASHSGIWDAFDVPLDSYRGKRVSLEVKVTKNGGETFPVRDVASGFLPYVFHTFGGLHGEVELIEADGEGLERPAAPSRVQVEGQSIYVDGEAFYLRGLLHWGWYPEIGHTNAPEETIRAEVLAAKQLGFNLIKFCLWVPPHRYLKILREHGMWAWLELPLWDPSSDPAKLQEIAAEMERIVRQYRHHDNILCWTVGCELSQATPPEYRQGLVRMVQNLTGSPLVKDNSGGAEMYGGDLREFGDFDDFHPYCDLPFYPLVLDSLLPGPRSARPVLLGEFNDVDVHRDLARTLDDMPYWVSRMPELNAQGVRWQYDLPGLLPENRFALEPRKSRHHALCESSRLKALFMRKKVHEAARSRGDLSGYVITGIRDTPISSSGFFDDWGDPRFSIEECLPWNGPAVLFQIPNRRPPWISGGNRPGWQDGFNYFVGQVFIRIGIHSESPLRSGLLWRIVDSDGRIVGQGGKDRQDVQALESREVGVISWDCKTAGRYTLRVEFAGTTNAWPIHVFEPLTAAETDSWKLPEIAREDTKIEAGGKSITFQVQGGIPCPFWREATYEFADEAWGLAERWERLLPISPDLALDPATLPEHEVVIRRIDTRTYKELPIAVRTANGIVTTLRPYGGLGTQPAGIARNPSGVELTRRMLSEG